MNILKIAFPYNNWPGGFLNSIKEGFEKLGQNTFMTEKFTASILNKAICRIPSKSISAIAQSIKIEKYNSYILESLEKFKPDIFFNQSGGSLFPSTIKTIQQTLKCTTIGLIADNPCDPSILRDKYFAMSLRYYDILLYPEPIWLKMLNNLAPKAIKIKFLGGYDPKKFYPLKKSEITKDDLTKFKCDLSFTGGSYHESAEGAYRSGILGQLNEFDVKFWGDEGWKWRFKYYPNLAKAYQGNRLSYLDLRKLYTISKINLNMPSPQIFTSFQPRVFEIAATKGFQLIDYSTELSDIFEGIHIPTFKSFDELSEKAKYFLEHEDERLKLSEEMYFKVKEKYTWEKQIEILLKSILKLP